MALFSMKCPKCGLIQSLSETCKSCGAAVEISPGPGSSPAQVRVPTASSQQPQGGPSQAEADTSRILRLSFHGAGGSLFGINIVNIFLSIITLGIYSFWGRVRVRRYLMSQTEFEGDRFAYHGTGKELLIGFLKAVLVFGVPLGLLVVTRDVLEVQEVIRVAAAVLAYGIFLLLIPFATVAARRYRLSRTSWRGIRFSFRGRVIDFMKLYLTGGLLTAITLGLYYPIFATKKHAFMVSHSYFGSERFHFDGQGRDLFGNYLLALLLTIPTVGLYWFWFAARKHRYFWDHTSVASARFHSTVMGRRLCFLNIGNLVLLVLTLSLAWAWVTVRNVRFVLRYLALEGSVDLSGIEQEAELASATGEGLTSFFDLDAGFDLG